MDWLITTAALYSRVLGRAAVLAIGSWPMAAVVLAYGSVMGVATFLMFNIGALGGFLPPLALAFCGGSFLYCVEAVVRTGKATMNDFRSSLGAYFSDVLGVMFALWIFQLLASFLGGTPYGLAITMFSSLLVWVFFNATPELIYLGHHSTMDLLGESYRFILQNWIEWFPLNIALGLVVLAFWNLPSGGVLVFSVKAFTGGMLIYFAMVMRGLLFLELNDSSRRSRIFRHRAGD